MKLFNNIVKAVIVDDERYARKDLHSLIKNYPQIEVVGEADSVTSAAKLINSKAPDLVFLDIQMPKQSGFELLKVIDVVPRIVFVTAYDKYALRAFEINALDYLLKPISPERFAVTINRVFEKSPSEVVKNKLGYEDVIFISIQNRLEFVKIKSIILISSAGDYSKIYTTTKSKGLVNKSLTEWELRLPQNYFARIHRSSIINLDFIENLVQGIRSDSYKVKLKQLDEEVCISRRYFYLLKDRLG
jgi:two-component system LytT family response regulator